MGAIVGFVMMGLVALSGLTYWGTFNGFQKKDEGVAASEREIASCYQKRGDVITNLANTVERFAGQEKDVILGNAQMRSGRPRLPDNATPEQIKEFVETQQRVNPAALINAVTEAVPSLASSANFLQMQKDLKDVENQCNLLRNRYIRSIQAYNQSVRSFPANVVANIHGYTKKEQIKFDDEARNKNSPRVFDKK